ncbi:Leucine-rich repeat-containing protein ODA7 [Dendrobium catenatum]|uniref:Leucine-rich repeat-containing protein ODA7 n=1 Tax=Dendrobium catenatum TaxID=906689 RepID=A0A2I0VPT4_9ASPA|nr:Leucine-rich repeat-containing protein ODA7 [Dendrobium catenatum]
MLPVLNFDENEATSDSDRKRYGIPTATVSAAMTRLSMEQISRENQNYEVGSVSSLKLSHRALSDVSSMFHRHWTALQSVSCLSNFQNLERLDLSYNCLTSLEGLSACVNLKWLQVLENKLVTLKGIEGLSKLTVLNAGRNKLEKMDEIYTLSNLRALILNDNNISSICKFDQMKYLNTLAIPATEAANDGDVAVYIKATKAAFGGSISAGNISSCLSILEVYPPEISPALPEELAKNIKLRTLDVGNNLIEKLSELKVLSTLHNLKNLNILGNPIAENENLVKKSQMAWQIKRLIPNIRIFNAKPSESSNTALKIYETGSLRPTKSDSLEIAFGVEDHKNRNKREYKQDDAFRMKRLNTYVEETQADESFFGNITDIEPEWKKKIRNSRADVDASEQTKISKSYSKNDYSTPSGMHTSNASVVKGAKKKSKSNTEPLEKETDVHKRNSASMEENIDKNVEKPKRKRSEVKLSAKFKDIDDDEAPFVDLIFLGKNIEELEREKGRETLNDCKLDQHSKKVKKRPKKFESEISSLHLLSSEHEIGMGGQSTWVDLSLAEVGIGSQVVVQFMWVERKFYIFEAAATA